MSIQDNSEQQEFWSGQQGETWLRNAHVFDRLFATVDGLLLDAALPAPGEHVLDMGSGSGATSRAFAALVAPGGSVLGLDISPLMVARAADISREEGGANVTFTEGDAATAELPHAAHDVLVSRFGAMFFADPVAGYRALRGTLKPGGRMVLACWADMASNPMFGMPTRLGIEHFGPQEASDPHAPGPMAFADVGRVEGILRDAGFDDVRGRPVDLHLCHPGGIEATLPVFNELGPLGRMQREHEADEQTRAALSKRLRSELAQFVTADGVLRLPARINLYTARRR
ncbi:class I SAM-dependent methyltransferase [Halovulum sp. GXIMD14794]